MRPRAAAPLLAASYCLLAMLGRALQVRSLCCAPLLAALHCLLAVPAGGLAPLQRAAAELRLGCCWGMRALAGWRFPSAHAVPWAVLRPMRALCSGLLRRERPRCPETLHLCVLRSRAAPDVLYSGMLEAAGPAAEEWLLSPEFEARLFAYFPCTDITPALANKVRPHGTLYPDITPALANKALPHGTLNPKGLNLKASTFEARLFAYFPCTDITPALANKVRPALASPPLQCSSSRS